MRVPAAARGALCAVLLSAGVEVAAISGGLWGAAGWQAGRLMQQPCHRGVSEVQGGAGGGKVMYHVVVF